MDPLKEKLDKVKDDHAEAELVNMNQAHDEKAIAEAMFFLGRVKQIDNDARAVATALAAQGIRALEHFLAEDKHKLLGYRTGVDFLEKSEYSPMTKRQYYDRLALVREHGDEIYDLLTSVGISVRAQKLLGKGELSIRGDRLMIGDTEVEVANTGVIKEVLEELFDEKRELTAKAAKDEEKIDKLTVQIDQGQRDFDELRRSYDRLLDGDPYDQALSHAVHSLLLLQEQIGHLPDEAKQQKAAVAMDTLWAVILKVRASYGSNYVFRDTSQTSQTSDTSSLVERVIEEDDDFGDEQEAPQ